MPLPLIVHEKPDDELRAICSELLPLKAKDPVTYRRLVRELCLKNPWFLMRVVLQWGFLDEDLVGREFIGHIAEHYYEDVLILLPRGHGKTVPMAAILIQEILRDPNIALMVIMGEEERSKSFGAMIANELMYNEILQEVFPDILPKPGMAPEKWGGGGEYILPNRKYRLDPTIKCTSIGSRLTGRHPDKIFIDDLIEEKNNTPDGWSKAERVVKNCWTLLPAHGKIYWTATRWHDADTTGKAESGELGGKRGPFKVLKRSCYIDDDPNKGVIYPEKVRWTMEVLTGYTTEMLLQARRTLGSFFNAQMRNDPLPEDEAFINVNDINVYNDIDFEIGEIRAVGVEETGGGSPIITHMKEKAEEMGVNVPWQAFATTRAAGLTKADRILAALQPAISAGRLYARSEHVSDPEDESTLAHELKRLGVGKHDDIADALYSAVVHLIKNSYPPKKSPADLYLCCDLAWTTGDRNDYSVLMAIAATPDEKLYVLDYDRFKIASPSGIWDRFLAFYLRHSDYNPRSSSKPKYRGWK